MTEWLSMHSQEKDKVKTCFSIRNICCLKGTTAVSLDPLTEGRSFQIWPLRKPWRFHVSDWGQKVYESLLCISLLSRMRITGKKLSKWGTCCCPFSTTTDRQAACSGSQHCMGNQADWGHDNITTEIQAWFQIHIQLLLGTRCCSKHWTSQWEASVYGLLEIP